MLTRKEKLSKALKSVRTTLRPSPHPAIPVFVMGEMRSGTNMLTEAFERTPRTEVFNENDENAFDAFALRPLGDIDRLIAASRASHVVFKCIADNARAVELLGRYAGGRVVWIYRRYEDVVNSALRKWTQHREYIRVVLEEPERAGWRRTNLTDSQIALFRRFYTPGLSDASARCLIWYVRNENYYTQSLERRSDVLLVNYEDLVTAPAVELQRVFNFLGLQVVDKSFGHMNTASVGREPVASIDEEIRSLCDDLMGRLDASRNRVSI
jgi:hypothetical protein